MDIDNTTGAKQLLASIAPAFAAVCSKGEDFLADFDGTIDYLYLDAFDVDHGRHSERRKERYREFLGEELTNSACWKMHLDCVKNCMGKFTPGAVVVFDDTVDMGEQARFAMEFCTVESCGKCTPCRIGSVRGVEVIDRIRAGENREANLVLLEELCETMVDGSLCAMGGMTPFPVQSVMTHFPDDLTA